MRPVILSRPEKTATGLAMRAASAGPETAMAARASIAAVVARKEAPRVKNVISASLQRGVIGHGSRESGRFTARKRQLWPKRGFADGSSDPSVAGRPGVVVAGDARTFAGD